MIAAIHLHLLHHPGPTIDYLGVALAAFAGWVGVPGPGEPVLIAASVFAAKHDLDISPVLVAAWTGATIGGIVGWLAGMWGGRSVLMAPGPLRKLRLNAIARGEEAFKRWEIVAIVLTPSWVAGIHRSGFVVYNTTNLLSAGVWAVGIGLGAYYAGPPILDLIADIGVALSIGLVALIGAAVSFEVARRRRRRRVPPGRRAEPGATD
jgi:membrane protein DedA with SNARE-associated domain